MSDLTIIGRAERVDLPDYGIFGVPAKVDTGADSSSVWATDINLRGETLCFKLFGPGSKYYSGEEVRIEPSNYRVTRVASSFGHRETRFAVTLSIVVHGRRIRATITLANRADKTYPMLLGRRLLAKKFLVDVSIGKPLKQAEARMTKLMKDEIAKLTNGGKNL